jgi:hypothetical protein
MTKPLVRGVIAFLIGFVGAVVVIQAIELAREDDGVTRVVLGSLDVNLYCRSLQGEQMLAALVADTAFGWRCVGRRNGIWGEEAVNMHEACRVQFGPEALPETVDPAEPRSWVCVLRA